jgi:serine/threonine protein kinase/DNA-binding beta-propeller fold protein YncE
VSEENPSAAGRFAAGSQIAGYRLEEQIGLGGMAVVFRAHDDRLDRMVALKILAPGLALDDAFRQRFIRESRAAAAVDDPHIIPVFEAGEASGVLFIAMRYVRGGDVRTLLDQAGPLPPARATEIISQVASALDAAHARGLVHRDVKPANMLLDASAGTDRPDHVYLSDFGLSKQALAPSGLTSTGQFLGTLDYVAPEQIEGRPVDGRTDEYALACAAFELLSGAPPFRRNEGLAVVYAQLSEPPPSLAARRSGLPPAIDSVLTRALAKSPADRYPTCRDFAVALREVFGLRPVDSGPSDSPPPRAATEIAMPVAGSRTGDEQARLAENQPPPQSAPAQSAPAQSAPAQSAQSQPPQPRPPSPQPAAGPATEAAGIPVTRPTRPGLTAPSSGPPSWAETPDDPRSGRSRWRTPAALAAACAVVLIIGGGAFLALRHGSGNGASGDGGSGNGGGSRPGQGTPASLAVPACTTATAKTVPPSKVRSASVPLAGDPFGAAVTADGRYSFVTLGNSIAMLRKGSGLAPVLVRTIAAAGANKGDIVTPDGRYLLAADKSGLIVISIAEAEQGSANPVVATLTSPHGSGAVGLTTSSDGRFAFVTLQTSDNLAVFNLARALAHGFTRADFIGYVSFDKEPDGIASSPDGKWLYVTSIDPGNSNDPGEGTLSVLSVSRAEVTPASAVVTKTTAGCQPARVITSPNGSVVWVTARQSNSLLGFSADKLRSAPAHSLIAKVAVGPNPIGLSLVRGGSRIVVADSDLSVLPGASPSVAVVNTSAALAGKPALLGLIPSGMVPRQFALEPNGKTLLVTNQNSHQLQALRVADLP